MSSLPEPSKGIVSITFDDGWLSQYTEARKKMDQYGFAGTAYIIPDHIGTSGYMTLQNLKDLQNQAGWDISAHHQTNFTTLTAIQVEQIILSTKNYLLKNGFSKGANDFAYPNGAYDETTVLPLVRKYFRSARTVTNYAETYPPADYHKLRVLLVTNTTAPSTIAAAVDRARINKEWLILVFHKIVATPTAETEYSITNFEAVIDDIASDGILVRTISDVLNKGEESISFTAKEANLDLGNKNLFTLGSVGIGTTRPGTLLTLRKSTTGNVFAVRNTVDTADTFTITDTGIVTLGTEIRFLELPTNGTNYVAFKAPDNIASNVIWTLPNSDGTSGQVLTTNGAGVLSWTTVSGGGGGGGYTTIQEEGVSLTQRATMNFIGAGLTAQDDATNSRTNITWDRFLAERKAPFYYTDFLGPAGAGTVEAAFPFDFVAISLGTIAKIAGESNHPGILRISSSTTANSGGYILTDATAFLISGGEVFEIIFQPRVSGNANTTIRMGFLDTTTSTDATDGVYFELPANSLDIVGKTADNATRTTSSTIATLTLNTWYRCRIEINSNATQANFYVYDDSGTLLGSTNITTNIPTATGRNTGAGLVATNSGTTATLLSYFDFMAIGYNNRELTR